MRNLVLLACVPLLAACPDPSAVDCPPDASLVGHYSLAYTAVHGAGECVATSDGSTQTLAVDAGVAPQAATFCLAAGADGGQQLQLLVPQKTGARVTDLLADGGFHFANDAGDTPGTACNCDVNIFETLDGQLLSSGSFQLLPDGGLPPITGVSATLTDHLVDSGTALPCLCTFPCTATYSVTGTPF